jgi:hypothetical protein
MPISDTDGYDAGHFQKVYEDILKPACKEAGYCPVRADDVKQTNLIHLDILQKLISSPMAICDLSSRNPNVLFELGLRQAFDMPTVLVQDIGTPKIFDIAPLRYTEYRRELRYREVLEDQTAITRAISETKDAVQKGTSVNSIVKILSLSKPASIEDISNTDPAGVLQLLRAEISELRSEFRKSAVARDSINIRQNDRSQINMPDVLEELRSLISEISSLVELNAPTNVILRMIGKARGKMLPSLENSVPPWTRDEYRLLMLKLEELELRTRTRTE